MSRPLTLAVASAVLLSGCGAGYYAQSVGGHLEVMRAARPLSEWFADPGAPEHLKQRLALAQRLRAFAVSELGLPDNASYQRFARIEREAVVWNVVAAPELSLTLKTWCVPVAGCVSYRGHFQREQAHALAERLRSEGLEVSVYGVPAYSTLGWTNWLGGDPLLDTFIAWPELELARLLFHELAHQVAYVADDTPFNESYATAVERLGVQRWLDGATPAMRDEHAAAERRRQDFRALAQSARQELEALYRSALPDDLKRQRKTQILADMRQSHRQMREMRWGGFAGYDGWVERVNNAALGAQATYDELVPGFERLFRHQGQDFRRFHQAVRELAQQPRERRRAQLLGDPLAPSTGPGTAPTGG